MAIEASITPLSTSNKANCTCREKNGTVAITSGTIAPGIPIVVPTMNLVNGINNIAKMINGIERNKFTTLSKVAYKILFSKIFPSRVTTKTTPNAIPNTPAINPVSPTIIKVSIVLLIIS